jgi:NADPH-dependent curcumin reductase CurA
MTNSSDSETQPSNNPQPERPTNRQWRLRSRPAGMVEQSNFELVEEPAGSPGEGEFLVRNLYLAFEPAMRGWLNDVKSYVPPVAIGEVMRASAVGQVIESRHEGYPVGTLVSGMLGWQEYALCNAKIGPMGAVRPLPPGIDPVLALGALGATGMTAYFGMIDIGKPGEGDVVLVSGAAGATGSIAGQIAKIAGAAKVVGIAGGARKCEWLVKQAGFDAAIDYKSDDVKERLRIECPKGIDLFFDNIGGELLDHALLNMAQNGRIVLCGGISAYNEDDLPAGPRNYMQLVIRRCSMQGFILIDHLQRAGEALGKLSKWIEDARLVHAEDVQTGFENTPATFLRLFSGANLGKQLLKIADAPIEIAG